MGAGQLQSVQDNFQYRRRFLKYLIVPKPDYPKSLSFDSPVATFIIQTTFLVLSSIELDDKFCIETHKICDVARDRHLPSKSVTSKLPTSQILPKVELSISGLIPQSAAATLCNGISHTTNYPTFCPRPNGPLADKAGSPPRCA